MRTTTHPASEIFQDMMYGNSKAKFVKKESAGIIENKIALFDDASTPMSAMPSHDDKEDAMLVASAIQEWAKTTAEDLGEGEGLGDRLFSLLAGSADPSIDGEIGDDDWSCIEDCINKAGDYLFAKGISADDAIALLNDFDNDIATIIQEQLVEKLPTDEQSLADIHSFAFDGVPVYDAASEEKNDETETKKEEAEEKAAESESKDEERKEKAMDAATSSKWSKNRSYGEVRISAKQHHALRKASNKIKSSAAKQMRKNSK